MQEHTSTPAIAVQVMTSSCHVTSGKLHYTITKEQAWQADKILVLFLNSFDPMVPLNCYARTVFAVVTSYSCSTKRQKWKNKPKNPNLKQFLGLLRGLRLFRLFRIIVSHFTVDPRWKKQAKATTNGCSGGWVPATHLGNVHHQEAPASTCGPAHWDLPWPQQEGGQQWPEKTSDLQALGLVLSSILATSAPCM